LLHIFLTGSSGPRGIGAATAAEFCRLGAKVVITGRNCENLEKVASNCAEISGSKDNVSLLEIFHDKKVSHSNQSFAALKSSLTLVA